MISPSPDFPSPGGDTEKPPVPQEAVEAVSKIGSRSAETAGGQPDLDERRGLPSASGMQRIIECPASLPLTERLRAIGKLPANHSNADSEAGDRVHEILEAMASGKPLAEFDRKEVRIAEDMWATVQEILTKTFGENLSEVDFHIEQRFWFLDPEGNDAASGKFDLIAVSESRRLAVVLDYKTGFNDVPQGKANWQLLTGAVLIAIDTDVDRVVVGIVERNGYCKPELVTGSDINRALTEIDMALARKHEDPFVVGFRPSDSNCMYCPCRLECPRLRYDMVSLQGPTNAEMLIATAPTPRLSEFIRQCESVALISKAAKAEMEARLNSGETDQHFYLGSSAPKRQINNAQKVAKALIAEGASVDDALGAMSMTLGAAEETLRAATGLKGKALKERLNEIAGEAIGMSEPPITLKSR